MKKVFSLLTILSLGLMSFATDWSTIAWLADGAGDGAYANKYKVEAAFGQNVINIQKPGFAAEAGIYTNFPAGISSCDLPTGKYVIEGAGMVMYLSAFTAKETKVSVEAGGVTYDFKVFYADGTGEISQDEPGDEPGDEVLEMNDEPLGNENIFLCATKNAAGEIAVNILNTGEAASSPLQVGEYAAQVTMPANSVQTIIVKL